MVSRWVFSRHLLREKGTNGVHTAYPWLAGTRDIAIIKREETGTLRGLRGDPGGHETVDDVELETTVVWRKGKVG